MKSPSSAWLLLQTTDYRRHG